MFGHWLFSKCRLWIAISVIFFFLLFFLLTEHFMILFNSFNLVFSQIMSFVPFDILSSGVHDKMDLYKGHSDYNRASAAAKV